LLKAYLSFPKTLFVIMSGGAPIPVITDKNESSKEAKILSIADLEEEGSKKLSRVTRGELYFLSGFYIQTILRKG